MASRAFSVGEGREYLLKRCSFMGLDVLLRDGRKNIMYYLSFWIPTFYQICCFYTFYLLGDDTVMILQCLTIWGAAGQCNIKMILAYIYRKGIRNVFDFLIEKHESIEDDPEIKRAFEKWAKRHYLLQRLIMYVLNMNMFMLSSYAILSFAIYHQRKYVVICYIPGLNPDPNAGFPDYEIQTTIHLICLFVGINELVALDGLFAYFIFNAASMADALIIHVRRMSLMLSQDSLSDIETTKYIGYLSQLHREYMEYVNRLDRMYNLMFLMQFGSFALSGSVGLYAAKISDWYAVYGIVFCTVFQLFFFCSLGSVIENKNIGISEEIYQTNWTAMSVKNRRMMLFMIQRASTVDTISVGHLSPLNLETGMSTYKILYSYFLLLQDAVKA